MNWFKFYGQDFLTDMKISQLSVAERLLWVTILCLAHSEGKGGNIDYCTEDLLKYKMGIQESDEEWVSLNGVLDLFCKLQMIEMTETGIFVKNFKKRQEREFTPAEKQHRYREKQSKVTNVTRSKVTNVTIDKNRIDKIRKEEYIAAPAAGSPKKKKEDYPMSLNEFVEWCRKGQPHIRVIGEWADTVKPTLKTRFQWDSYISRHLRAAQRIVPFDEEQIKNSYEEMQKAEKDWLHKATLETLLKFVV